MSGDSYQDEHKTPRNITKFTCDLTNMNTRHGFIVAPCIMDSLNLLHSNKYTVVL